MTSQFRWPFSMRYLYTVDELRSSSQPPLSTPIAASQRSNQHHTFEWPFSLKYLYTVDEFRLGSSSTPPSQSSVVTDVPTLPGKRGSTSVEVEATPVASSSRKRKTRDAYASKGKESYATLKQKGAEAQREAQAEQRRYIFLTVMLFITLIFAFLPVFVQISLLVMSGLLTSFPSVLAFVLNRPRRSEDSSFH